MEKASYVIILISIVGSALYCGYQWGVFTYVVLFLFILIISWFVHKEIKSTRMKSASSEDELNKERIHLEEQVRKKTLELRSSENSRIYELGKIAEFGRLSQGLFHDLLSPLSSLSLHMEKAKKLTQVDLENSHTSLLQIAETSQKMNENLEYLREHMANSIPARECSIRKELEYSLRLLKFKAYEGNVKINIDEQDPCIWYGDAIKIRHIFSNVISNALDAFPDTQSENKCIHITIRKAGDPERLSSLIEIRDNGTGIPPEIMDKIFTPYFTTKASGKGSGVGLSIVRNLLEEIEGKISVESTPGSGSIFTISLP